MTKDTVVASIIGFGLGLIAAIVLWLGPQFLSQNTTTPAPNLSDTQTNPATPQLTITTPDDDTLTTEPIITVAGAAGANDFLVITSPIDEAVTTATPEGSFGVSIELEEGQNEITITQYAVNGQAANTKSRAVIYSSEDL